jgi:hypothetical protein
LPKLTKKLILLFRALTGVGAGPAVITFPTVVGVGGGGIKTISGGSGGAGITTVNDAGGAGLPFGSYNPTTDVVELGNYAVSARAVMLSAGASVIRFGNTNLNMDGNFVRASVNTEFYIRFGAADGVIAGGNGWLLAKGCSGDDRSDFINTDWAVAAAPGVKWRIQTVTAPADVAGRGGIERFGTATVTPCVLDGLKNSYSAQDGYRMYARFCINSDANDFYGVGVCDAPAAVAPNSIPYVNDAALIVHISGLGVNWFHRTVVGAGAVSVDTGIAAVVGEYVRVDQIALPSRAIQLYINGTLVTTSVAAQSPLAATLLRKVLHANNSGGAVSAFLDIDVYDIVESRNVAVTP